MNLVERIASVQQEIKQQLAGNSSVLKEEIKKITSKSCESETVKTSNQPLVSALVSECLISTFQCLISISLF